MCRSLLFGLLTQQGSLLIVIFAGKHCLSVYAVGYWFSIWQLRHRDFRLYKKSRVDRGIRETQKESFPQSKNFDALVASSYRDVVELRQMVTVSRILTTINNNKQQ